MIISTIAFLVIFVLFVKAHTEAAAHSKTNVMQWTAFILGCEDIPNLRNRGINKTNAVLCIMFTLLSVVMVHTGLFAANVMLEHGTHVVGMGWVLVASYIVGVVGSMGYAIGYGAHVSRRDDNVVLPPAPKSRCYVL